MSTAINREQAAKLLHQVSDDRVKIWSDENNDCHIVIVAHDKATGETPQKGKWAQVAEQMRGILDHEAAKELRHHIKDFRENFAFRDIPLSGKK